MNKKIFGLIGLSFLSLVILMSSVSAVVDFVSVTNNGGSVEQGDSVIVSFEAEEDGYGNLTNISFNTPITMTSGSNSFNSSDTVTNAITILNQSTTSGTMSLTFDVSSTQAIGTYTGTLTLTGTYTTTVNYDLPITLTVIEPPSDEPSEVSACSVIGNPNNNLRIKDIDITNNGFSDKEFGDDNEWFPLDEIEVDIEIENNGDEKIEDIEVEWGLYDTQANEWIIELEDEKDFDLKRDKDEVLTIDFKLDKDLDVDLEDLDDGDHYAFYVIATGFDNEIDEDVCVSDSEEIEIIIESDFVVLDNFKFPETVSCGADVQIIADVWNIGDDDQEDVYVRVFNTELGINEKVDIGDVDAFSDENLNVVVDIPEDAEEKIYSITFEVYDENDDIFENDFDDDESVFRILLEVSGSCGAETTSALVSASLESGGKAGEELVVKAIIVNTGTKSSTYNLNAVGYSGWAESVDVEPSIVLINVGESREVLFTFDVKDDVSGEQVFDIEGISEGELIFTQPVSVSIEESGGITGITGGVISGRNNLYLWGIGALNIILVIIIIIVAIRVARK